MTDSGHPSEPAIAHLKQLCDAATPGPWRVHQHSDNELWLSIGHLTREGTNDPEGRWIGPVAEIKYVVTPEAEQRANADFIAAARSAVPALLAVAAAVQRYVDRQAGHAPDCRIRGAGDCACGYEALRAALAHLKEPT